MNIKIQKSPALNAILLAEKMIGKKESLPVLSCILLDAQKSLIVRATNLEAGIEVTIPCDVIEKGILAVPASIFSQTLRSIGADIITLRSDEENLIVESKGTKTLIKAIPNEEFPILTNESKGKEITISREKFLRGLQAVAYAASTSMIRPELGSIYVSLKRDGLVCVATDSFRLAEKKIVGVVSEDGNDILIPLKHVGELSHTLERIAGESILLGVDDAQLTVSGDGVRFMSRVVDANFPDYKTIIPKSALTEATLLKADLAEMLKKARVFAGGEQHVGLHIYPGKKIFSATARSADVGEMSDTLDAAVSGEDLDINFHIGYLAECLPSLPSDSVTLSFAGPGRPLVIRGVGDASFMYLVMPLNK